MPRVNGVKRQQKSNLANLKIKLKKSSDMKDKWQRIYDEMDAFEISNNKGFVRSSEENKLILLSMKMLLKHHLMMAQNNQLEKENLT
jgi:hypothetical protein